MPGAKSAAAPPAAGLCPRGSRPGPFPASAEFHWQAGYSAFSLSSEDVAAVADFIGRPREHHERAAFVSILEWKDGVTAPPQVGWRPF